MSSVHLSQAPADPLLECLVTVTRLHQRPHSATTLSAGLPLGEQGLTPDLCLRAAKRADLSGKYLTLALDELDPLLLPAILLLNDQQACVLLAKETDHYLISLPHTPEGEITISHSDLHQRYSGQCILLKPRYQPQPTRYSQALRQGHWFWTQISASWKIYGEVGLASILINLFALAMPLFVMNVYDRVVPNQAYETLWVLAFGVLLVFTFEWVFKLLRSYFVDLANRRADILLGSATYAKVLDLPLNQRPNSQGSFANSLQEFDNLRDFFTSSTLVTVIDIPFALLFLLVLLLLGGSLVWIPLIAIPLMLACGLLLQRPLRRLIAESLSASAEKHAILLETLQGIEDIKSFVASNRWQQRWEQRLGHLADLGLRSRQLHQYSQTAATFIQQFAAIATIVVGVYFIDQGQLSLGGLIACTILVQRSLTPFNQAASLLTRWQHARTAYQTLDTIMQLPEEHPDGQRFIHRDQLQGKIHIRDLSFGYPDQKNLALKDISFSLNPGERVALLGRTGAGKSTLNKLLLNFYPPSQGSILFDDVDIHQLDPYDLRRHIGYVSQDAVLFSGSLRDNLTLAVPHCTDMALQNAIEIAGLQAFIQQHPQGLDMQISEYGRNLSGGQRQAIALARALLHDPCLVLLDEPTSHMDQASEQHVLRQLDQWLAGRTLLVVTHKMPLLNLVERILVLDQGKLVADGPKQQVLQALGAGNPG